MTGETLTVFVILAFTILLFVSDRLRLDLVAVLALLALTLTGILTPAEAFAGFSDPLVIMIAALFVVAAGMFRTGLSPSLLLMPMAVGALVGGLLTLIATPPNIIVSNQLAAAGYEPFAFFDFTPVGLVMLAVGTTVLALFGGRMLPARAPVDRPAGADEVCNCCSAW